jgi:hypothetical protein
VFGPDLPLQVTLVVRIPGVYDLHPGLSGEREEVLNLGYGLLRVGNDERVPLPDAVVLHIHNDQGRPREVHPDLLRHLVLWNLPTRSYECSSYQVLLLFKFTR